MKQFILKLLGVAEKAAMIAAPAAAGTFGGPLAGSMVAAVISDIQASHSAGVKPNADQLTTSIGQIITGVIGYLEATGRIKHVVAPAPPSA